MLLPEPVRPTIATVEPAGASNDTSRSTTGLSGGPSPSTAIASPGSGARSG